MFGAFFKKSFAPLVSSFFLFLEKLTALSEQYVLDCEPHQNCSFTSFSKAIGWLNDIGSMTEKDYRYKGRKGSCPGNSKKPRDKFTDIRHIVPGDTKALEYVLYTEGPVSVQMPASQNLQFYSSGIFESPMQNRALNFAALIVGYGYDATLKEDYWLVKNSFGTKWGENGYIKIAKYENDACVSGALHYLEV